MLQLLLPCVMFLSNGSTNRKSFRCLVGSFVFGILQQLLLLDFIKYGCDVKKLYIFDQWLILELTQDIHTVTMENESI